MTEVYQTINTVIIGVGIVVTCIGTILHALFPDYRVSQNMGGKDILFMGIAITGVGVGLSAIFSIQSSFHAAYGSSIPPLEPRDFTYASHF
jgi:dipeptide/tripeptide permease